MNCNVIAIPAFEKQIKKLVKKYPYLKTEYINLVHILEKDAFQGIR